jgi:uncharacterized protein
MHRRFDHALVFMAKWPEPGRAKTRLAPPLTPFEAAGLARCFLLDMLDSAAGVAADRWIAFAPAARAADFRRLVGDQVGLIPAEFENFGDALRTAQRAALAKGYHSVSLIASDLPHLPADRYLEAFAALRTVDIVLGPCSDGGYYLLASEKETPTLFHGVAWSTAEVYSQTLQRAAEAGLQVAQLASCDDVDSASDLRPLLSVLSVCPGAGRTLGLLRRLAPGCPVTRMSGLLLDGERAQR